MKNQIQAFAVVRLDNLLGTDVRPSHRIVVKEVVPTEDEAKAEVKRLTDLNQDTGCVYFWTCTRLIGFGGKKKT